MRKAIDGRLIKAIIKRAQNPSTGNPANLDSPYFKKGWGECWNRMQEELNELLEAKDSKDHRRYKKYLLDELK